MPYLLFSSFWLLLSCWLPFSGKPAFSTSTTITIHTMELNQTQIESIKKTALQLQQLKAYCKAKGIDLNTLLNQEQKVQMKSAMTFLKEWLPKAQATGSLDEETIPKGEFVRTALRLLKALDQSEAMKKLNGDWAAFSIDKTILIEELNKISLKTPLGAEIRARLISQAGDNVSSIIAILKNIIGTYALKNGAMLKKHYSVKNQKEYYRQKEVIITDLEFDLEVLTGQLDECVAAAINDPKFGPNIEKQKEKEREQKEKEKEQKEKEKEIQAKIEEFKTAYGNWVTEQQKIVSEIINSNTKTDSVFNMSKTKFLAILANNTDAWFKDQPELAENLRTIISGKIAQYGDSLTVKNCVDALNAAILDISTPKDVIYQHWLTSRRFPSFYPLKTAIITSTDGSNIYDFRGHYLSWGAKLAQVPSELNLSNQQQFIPQKLLEGFQQLFQEAAVAFFYPELEQNLKQLNKAYPSMEEVSLIWEQSLYQVSNGDAVQSYYQQLLEAQDSNAIANIGGILDTLIGSAQVVRVFEKAKRPSIKTKPLAKGEAVELQILLADQTILTTTFSTEIVRLDSLVGAIPTSASLAVSSGSEGYEFELIDFSTQSPINNSEGILSYFTYKIPFKKGKGSTTSGTSSSSSYGGETGWEQSINEVEMKNWNNQVRLEGGNKIVEGGYTRQWGGESGTETTKGTFGSINLGKSSGSSETKTKELGTDSSYLVVSGSLYAFEYDKGGTLKVSIEIQTITSPNFRGNAVKGIKPTKDKVIRWAK